MAWDDCFERALALTDLLNPGAEASLDEGGRVRAEAVCLSIFPLVFHCVAEGEYADTPEAFAEVACVDGPFGAGFQALWRRDLPEQVCRAVFPALWPNRHMEVVRWWEGSARPNWLAPRIALAGRDGAFARILERRAPREGEAYDRWGERHHAAWRKVNRLGAVA